LHIQKPLKKEGLTGKPGQEARKEIEENKGIPAPVGLTTSPEEASTNYKKRAFIDLHSHTRGKEGNRKKR